MERETEVSLIAEILALAGEKSSNVTHDATSSPVERYLSPDRFQIELVRIFKKSPIVIAHHSELAENNAFLGKEFLSLPLLLTRDGDGKVHAFINVCRHRGAKIERRANGCKKLFTCPYHGWTYTNEGALRSVPHEAQGFPDLSKKTRGLRALNVIEAYGFIWIVTDPDASAVPDLPSWFEGLGADLDWLQLATHRVAVSEEFDVNANWKILVEGGLESYHFRVAHKDTIGPYFPDNLSTYQMFGPHVRSVLPRSSLMQLAEVPQTDWQLRRDANMVYSFMPNFQLLVQQDHIVWIHMEPLSAEKTHVRIATLVPSDDPRTDDRHAHWQKNHAITLATLKEDFTLGEEIQSGL